MSGHPETPKKVYKTNEAVTVSCCRLCKAVGDTSRWRNLYSKGNRQLLAIAEEVYGNALQRSEFLPHLLCRPCERRLNNFTVFKSTIFESQASFELKVKRCIEESPSAPHTIKSLKTREEVNVAGNVSGNRSRRRINLPSTTSTEAKVSTDCCERVFFAYRIICEKFAV